ncbi:MAG: hypothetical protein WCT05_07980, partial [Lentisphaeria bacterium]
MKKQTVICKQGTIDLGIVESNPVVFQNELYRFEYIRCGRSGYPDNHSGDSYFRFVRVRDNAILPPFGKGLHLGNAFVWQNRIFVTAVEGWGKSRFYQLESDDMLHWSEPRVILEHPSWQGYNTSLCRGKEDFILTFELGAPAELVHVPFTMFFARSKDLKQWEFLEDCSFGRDFYTGGPMLRYFSPWFYFFYLHGSYQDGFQEYVARSQNLQQWENSALNPILSCDEADRKIAAKFNPARIQLIHSAININNSDMDCCEWQNR